MKSLPLLFFLILIFTPSVFAQNDPHFLMGINAFKESRFTDAEQNFQEALKESPTLEYYIRYWIGKTLNAEQKYRAALDWLNPPPKLLRQIDNDTFWERIDSLVALGQGPETTTLLNRHKIETMNNDVEQQKIIFYQGLIASKSGQKDKAHLIWKILLTQNAGSPYEEIIIQQLNRESKSIESFLNTNALLKRASKLLNWGLPDEAMTLYEHLQQRGLPLKEEMANAAFKKRDYARAAELYEQLAFDGSFVIDRPQLYLQLATCYGRSDQFDKALIYHRKIIELYPHSSLAQQSRYKIPFIYFDSGQYEKAFEAFSNFLAENKRYKTAEATIYRMWAAYLQNNFQFVLNELENEEHHERSSEGLARILYWEARCLDQMGKKEESHSHYQQVIRTKPLSYYGFLALQQLRSGNLVTHTLVDARFLDLIPKYVDAIPSSNYWQRDIPANSQLARGVALAKIGLTTYAFDETEQDKKLSANLNLEELASVYEQAQNFNRLSVMGSAALKIKSPKEMTPFYWQLAYPKAYFQWIEKNSQKTNLDPLLALSLMRQESAFKPFVVSSANAIGLTQIIPKTAMEIARNLGENNFHPEDLHDPATSIRFGTWYLSQRLQQFNGNLSYALASYNAGPEAVERWKKWGDWLAPDLFIELIPYDETNNYVKKVLTNYWIYSRLYGN